MTVMAAEDSPREKNLPINSTGEHVFCRAQHPPRNVAKPVRMRDQKAKQAIEYYRREYEANADSADACNGLAWALVTAPEASRNVEEAVTLAEKTVRLAPEVANFRNTLGVAYYRSGRYREAVEILRNNLTAQPDSALASICIFWHEPPPTGRRRACS
jgi:tetratricopeptide (TPR) repeat protein